MKFTYLILAISVFFLADYTDARRKRRRNMPSWDEIKTAMIETWNEDDNNEAVIEAK